MHGKEIYSKVMDRTSGCIICGEGHRASLPNCMQIDAGRSGTGNSLENNQSTGRRSRTAARYARLEMKGVKKMKNLGICFAVVVLGTLFATKGYSQSEMDNMSACLALEDMTKERLDCYDILVPPTPKLKPPIAKVITDCKFLREQDERLKCFNRFLERPLPKVAPSVAPKRTPRT
jgi:hypothetical protein